MNPDHVIFIVDDDPSMREALANMLGSLNLRVRCFSSAQEFLRFRRPDAPACLVLDVRMGGLSGLDLQRELATRPNPLPIVFMTAYGDVPMAVEALKAGAVEFLPKPFREQAMLDAVRRALESDRTARARRQTLAGLNRKYHALSPREHDVVEFLIAGRLNKQIAAELRISEVTVKVHRRRIMEKMNASTFAELVYMIERLRGTVQ